MSGREGPGFYRRSTLPSVSGQSFPYQPDSGMADIYTGVKWTFYSTEAITLAASAYLNFPTGSLAFRNPGIQPTLTLTATTTAGALDFCLSVGTTYAADVRGEPCYFDLETAVSIDYSSDGKIPSEFLLTDIRRTGAGTASGVFPAAGPTPGPSASGIRRASRLRKVCPAGSWTGPLPSVTTLPFDCLLPSGKKE